MVNTLFCKRKKCKQGGLIILFLIGIFFFFSSNIDTSPPKLLDTIQPEIPAGIINLHESILPLCSLSQQYIRGVAPLMKQSCISKGQSILISPQYLLTAKHVVANLDTTYYVQVANTYKVISNIWHHPHYDLALLKIAEILPERDPITHIHENNLLSGTSILRYNKGDLFTGRITNIQHDVYTTNLALSPTDSGSPIFDKEKKLIGINIATSTQKNTSYAINVTYTLLQKRSNSLQLDLF